MSRQNSTLALIRPNPYEGELFITGDVIGDVLPFSRAVRYRKNDQVVVEGEYSRSLYYVQEGAVEVSYTLGKAKIVVALIGPGEFFGEIGFFEGATRVRDIKATENSLIRVFDEDSFGKIQQGAPELYGGFLKLILKNVCDKFRRVLSEHEPLTAYAASLSTGGRSFDRSLVIPDHLFKTSEWHFVHKAVEEFKAQFFDLSHQLQKDVSTTTPEVLHKKCDVLLNGFNGILEGAFKRFGNNETADSLWGYVFKEIFPYFMRSRFAERAYFKPRGYAGDFLMMEMIYRGMPAGDGKLGKLVDGWCLNTNAAKAVRGRRNILRQRIESECHARFNRQGAILIMNLACGSSRELFDFLSECDFTERIEATCVDADPKALEYTARHVETFPHMASIRLMNENIVKWALGRVGHTYGLQDIIYSAGLTDYLDRRLSTAFITRCHEHLKPGGILIVSNFGPNNPNRAFMDHILHWRLIYRDAEDLRDLFTESPFGGDIELVTEEQGLNLFALAKKRRDRSP